VVLVNSHLLCTLEWKPDILVWANVTNHQLTCRTENRKLKVNQYQYRIYFYLEKIWNKQYKLNKSTSFIITRYLYFSSERCEKTTVLPPRGLAQSPVCSLSIFCFITYIKRTMIWNVKNDHLGNWRNKVCYFSQ